MKKPLETTKAKWSDNKVSIITGERPESHSFDSKEKLVEFLEYVFGAALGTVSSDEPVGCFRDSKNCFHFSIDITIPLGVQPPTKSTSAHDFEKLVDAVLKKVAKST